jgi:hypothetical protein
MPRRCLGNRRQSARHEDMPDPSACSTGVARRFLEGSGTGLDRAATTPQAAVKNAIGAGA